VHDVADGFMKTFRVIFLTCLGLILASFTAFPQQEEIEGYDSISDRVLVKKEMTGGITLHILGLGGNFRKGKNKTFFNSRIFEVEIVSMKHPKQIRVINPYFYNARSYVYGKLNHVYMLRGSYGFKKLLNRKPYWGGVELRLLYMGGISLALTKPVYLKIFYEEYPNGKDEKYDPDNQYHTPDNIIGRSAFFEGMGQIKLYPGVLAKVGLNFEFGALNSKIRALEVGAVLEVFPIAVPIMAYNPEQNFFPTFYLNFSLGKRYN
jgi:hypothetical protein